jgi:hypothetical protein
MESALGFLVIGTISYPLFKTVCIRYLTRVRAGLEIAGCHIWPKAGQILDFRNGRQKQI